MDYTIDQNVVYNFLKNKKVVELSFKKIKGKSGKFWYVGIQENEADDIYVSASPAENSPGYKGFRGFGGSTLNFKLEDGTIDELKGPWHSNSGALYVDTGYDVRDKYFTFGVISREMSSGSNPYTTIMKDVIYKDEEPILGAFDRIDKISKDLANKEGKPLLFAEFWWIFKGDG